MSWSLSRVLYLPLALGLAVTCCAEEDPESDWVDAYGWLRTGERLAEVEHWPLALGSYIESHRQIGLIKKNHPNWESEMVAYRLEWLEAEMAALQERLEPGEHEIMRKYVDFIDSFEQGMSLRFENRYTEALDALDIAKVRLDEIIREKPEDFQDAVETQYGLLAESIEWLDSQINFRQRSRPVSYVGGDVDWGTTEFVDEADLPSERGNDLLDTALFPGGLVAAATGDAGIPEAGPPVSVDPAPAEDASVEEPEGPSEAEAGLPGFRMSSKQEEIPTLPPGVSGVVEGDVATD